MLPEVSLSPQRIMSEAPPCRERWLFPLLNFTNGHPPFLDAARFPRPRPPPIVLKPGTLVGVGFFFHSDSLGRHVPNSFLRDPLFFFTVFSPPPFLRCMGRACFFDCSPVRFTPFFFSLEGRGQNLPPPPFLLLNCLFSWIGVWRFC